VPSCDPIEAVLQIDRFPAYWQRRSTWRSTASISSGAPWSRTSTARCTERAPYIEQCGRIFLGGCANWRMLIGPARKIRELRSHHGASCVSSGR
jgi:hypothetical protein